MKETKGAFLHGTNCVGGFGSGVAGLVRRAYPEVYQRFQQKGTGLHLLGTIDTVKLNDEFYIINGYTQNNCGNDGKRYADPAAIDRVLYNTCEWIINNELYNDLTDEYSYLELKAPKIGAGLGGLSWENDVMPIFEQYNKLYNELTFKIYYI